MTDQCLSIAEGFQVLFIGGILNETMGLVIAISLLTALIIKWIGGLGNR